jgi:hypothetical protein
MFKEQKMDILFKSEMDLAEASQVEPFPMQEQDFGAISCLTEKPAAIIFAERLTETGSGFAALGFIP